jgi:tripartite-type tricarboxylate transporter receptor subunit TctC
MLFVITFRRNQTKGATMIFRSRFIRLVTVSAAVVICAPSWSADQFPSKEIRLVVPWNAGGSNDISARALAQILGEKGVRVIVDNVPGATGAIGMQRVANAAPDGYTVGMGTSSTLALMAQGLTPLRNEQFTAIARVTTDPLILLVPAASKQGSLELFVDHAKKNNGKISIGTPGSNNLNHIFAVMSGRVVGSEVLVVPYTGGSRVIADLAGQQIDAGVLKPSESKAQIDGNLVKPIGVFANERLKVLPEVPTFKEKGYDVFPYGQLVQMAYIAAPANLPPDVHAKLINLFQGAIQSAKFKAVADQGGALVDDLTGPALSQTIVAMEKTLKEVGKQVFLDAKK